MGISCFLEKHARDDPAAEAIVFRGQRISYGEYNRRSERIAAGLLKAGIARGDRIGIYMSGRPEYLDIYMAAAKIGAIAVPLSRRFTPPEIRFVINDAGISLLFTMPGFRGIDFVKNLEKIRRDVPCLRRIVLLDGEPADRGTVAYSSFVRAPDAALRKAAKQVADDDIMFLMYTPGLAGVPRGSMISHANLIAYAQGMVGAIGAEPGDSLLLNVPLNRIGGVAMAMMSCLYLGNRLVITDTFVPEESLKIIEREKIAIIGQAPAQYAIELLNPFVKSYNFSSVKIAIVTGQTCPADLISRIRDRMGVLPMNAYGLTEACGAITFTRTGHGEDKLKKTVGLPMEGADLAIVDERNSPLPPNQLGEIVVKGPTVMRGYWNRPHENRKAFDRHGYFHTGDIGMLDDDGFLVLCGRKNEMYIRGGENVYPIEVERALGEHPAVMMAAVAGRPDPVMGEVGRAYIVPRSGVFLTPEAIKEYLSGKLASFKIPEDIVFRNNLPVTSSGAVRKLELYEDIKKEFRMK
ncbi:MAG: acyl--CoA ligase [Spirochaetes bacterium]|nr:acyl--CoA ligase [Spirochaetota bacterium]